MRLPTKLSSREGDLLRQLGKGRESIGDAGRMTLGFTPQPRCELVLECNLDEQPLRLGIVEAQWRNWLAAEMPVPAWSMLAEDLRLPLAALTLVTLQSALQTLGVPCPTARTLERAAADTPQKGWFLRLEHDGRVLKLQLLHVPLDWLASLLNALVPVDEPDDSAPASLSSVPLVAGWSSLERTRLLSLRCGDALVLRQATAVAENRVLLFLQRPLCTLKILSPDTLQIESIMPNVDDWLDVQPAPCSDNDASLSEARVTVVAEVARLELALNRLASLQKGDILQGPIHQDELVTLKVGGQPFAYGMLLDIDGQLAVRIERLA